MSESTSNWVVKWTDPYGDTSTTVHTSRESAEDRWAELVEWLAPEWTAEELDDETVESHGWLYSRRLVIDNADMLELDEARA